jgi:hypothetical protein
MSTITSISHSTRQTPPQVHSILGVLEIGGKSYQVTLLYDRSITPATSKELLRSVERITTLHNKWKADQEKSSIEQVSPITRINAQGASRADRSFTTHRAVTLQEDTTKDTPQDIWEQFEELLAQNRQGILSDSDETMSEISDVTMDPNDFHEARDEDEDSLDFLHSAYEGPLPFQVELQEIKEDPEDRYQRRLSEFLDKIPDKLTTFPWQEINKDRQSTKKAQLLAAASKIDQDLHGQVELADIQATDEERFYFRHLHKNVLHGNGHATLGYSSVGALVKTLSKNKINN